MLRLFTYHQWMEMWFPEGPNTYKSHVSTGAVDQSSKLKSPLTVSLIFTTSLPLCFSSQSCTWFMCCITTGRIVVSLWETSISFYPAVCHCCSLLFKHKLMSHKSIPGLLGTSSPAKTLIYGQQYSRFCSQACILRKIVMSSYPASFRDTDVILLLL